LSVWLRGCGATVAAGVKVNVGSGVAVGGSGVEVGGTSVGAKVDVGATVAVGGRGDAAGARVAADDSCEAVSTVAGPVGPGTGWHAVSSRATMTTATETVTVRRGEIRFIGCS
jgi:hypothetical protein